MKQVLIFFLFLIAYSHVSSAQCYIQYTYDTSGNRIKREYIGGCAKPGSAGDQHLAYFLVTFDSSTYRYVPSSDI